MTTTFMYMSDLSAMVLIVIYLPVCVGVIWLVNRSLKKGLLSTWTRRGLLVCLSIVMFLLPTWDAILGKYYLDQLCEDGGGTFVKENTKVKGIYVPYVADEKYAKSLLSYGFSFVEMKLKKGGITRFFLDQQEELTHIAAASAISHYTIGHDSNISINKPLFMFGAEITMHQTYVQNIDNGEKVAGYREYTFQTALDNKFSSVGSPPQRCRWIPSFQSKEKFSNQTKYFHLISEK